MAHQAHIRHAPPTSLPGIHGVKTDNPWNWLAAGWSDFVKAPVISLSYGFIVTMVMIAVFTILQTGRLYVAAFALMAGFVFIGPLLAVGLYEISRRLERRERVAFSNSLYGWRRNTKSVLGIGAIMLMMFLVWLMLSAQVTAMLYGITGSVGSVVSAVEDWESFVFSITGPMVIAFSFIGLLAVAVTYVITVVSVPMLIDKEDMDMITAIGISVQTVKKNPAAMTLWAALIAAFTSVAVAPIFLGLIVVFPLLAFASWHAYRDLIEH